MHGLPALDTGPTAAGVSSPAIEARRVSANELAALMLDARRMAQLAAVFSNPTRSRILMLLESHGTLGVTTLAILVGSSVSLVSHNLAILKVEGWVVMSRLGRMRQVRLAHPQRLLAIRHLRDAGRLSIADHQNGPPRFR